MTQFHKIRKWAESKGYEHNYKENPPPYTGKQKRVKIRVNEDLYFVVGMEKSTVPTKYPHGRVGERGGLYLGENDPVPTIYQYSQALAILNMERAIEKHMESLALSVGKK